MAAELAAGDRRRARDDRLAREEAPQVGGQRGSGLVAPRAVLLERLHHDPVEIAAQQGAKATRFDAALCGDRAALAARTLVHSRGLRPLWLVHPDIADEMGESSEDPNIVVLGDMGPYFTYPILNHAFRLLMDGVPLMAMARNRYFMEPDGLSLDMGAFVAGLEYSAGVTAEITGKPAPAFFNAALSELGLSAADTVLIGDDLSDDIGGAQAVGIPGILVRTGKFRPGDDTNPDIRPAAVFDNFAAAVDAILG